MGRLLARIDRLARRPRWTAALLLWVYACTSLLGGLHLVVETHSLCAHGELTHVEDACAFEEGAAREGESRAPRAEQGPESERGDLHDHCAWGGRDCQERAARDAHANRAPQRADVPVAPPREECARSSVPVLALAPHHGPPRRV